MTIHSARLRLHQFGDEDSSENEEADKAVVDVIVDLLSQLPPLTLPPFLVKQLSPHKSPH